MYVEWNASATIEFCNSFSGVLVLKTFVKINTQQRKYRPAKGSWPLSATDKGTLSLSMHRSFWLQQKKGKKEQEEEEEEEERVVHYSVIMWRTVCVSRASVEAPPNVRLSFR